MEHENPSPFSLPVWPDGRTRNLQGKRVAIFGSLLNAYFLAEECLASGVKVDYFLDSSPLRQRCKLDGLAIRPLDWLRDHPVDLVIVSCEKRSADQVIPILATFTSAPVMSWRDL